MHDPWAQLPPPGNDRLPPDVQKIVDDFLTHPDRRKELRVAADAARQFVARIPAVGVLVALSEIEDRDMRMSMARALHEVWTVGRKPASG